MGGIGLSGKLLQFFDSAQAAADLDWLAASVYAQGGIQC